MWLASEEKGVWLLPRSGLSRNGFAGRVDSRCRSVCDILLPPNRSRTLIEKTRNLADLDHRRPPTGSWLLVAGYYGNYGRMKVLQGSKIADG